MTPSRNKSPLQPSENTKSYKPCTTDMKTFNDGKLSLKTSPMAQDEVSEEIYDEQYKIHLLDRCAKAEMKSRQLENDLKVSSQGDKNVLTDDFIALKVELAHYRAKEDRQRYQIQVIYNQLSDILQDLDKMKEENGSKINKISFEIILIDVKEKVKQILISEHQEDNNVKSEIEECITSDSIHTPSTKEHHLQNNSSENISNFRVSPDGDLQETVCEARSTAFDNVKTHRFSRRRASISHFIRGGKKEDPLDTSITSKASGVFKKVFLSDDEKSQNPSQGAVIAPEIDNTVNVKMENDEVNFRPNIIDRISSEPSKRKKFSRRLSLQDEKKSFMKTEGSREAPRLNISNIWKNRGVFRHDKKEELPDNDRVTEHVFRGQNRNLDALNVTSSRASEFFGKVFPFDKSGRDNGKVPKSNTVDSNNKSKVDKLIDSSPRLKQENGWIDFREKGSERELNPLNLDFQSNTMSRKHEREGGDECFTEEEEADDAQSVASFCYAPPNAASEILMMRSRASMRREVTHLNNRNNFHGLRASLKAQNKCVSRS